MKHDITPAVKIMVQQATGLIPINVKWINTPKSFAIVIAYDEREDVNKIFIGTIIDNDIPYDIAFVILTGQKVDANEMIEFLQTANEED